MLIEALLAYAHITAILAVVVFLTSEAALCRIEWINAAVIRRLARVDLLYVIAAAAVLVTGVARTWWGIKGTAWYWHQPLLHVKLTLFVIIGLLSIKPTFMFIRWRKKLDADGGLPGSGGPASAALDNVGSSSISANTFGCYLISAGYWHAIIVRADFDLMYGIVAPKCGFPLGVATRLMVTPLARSATTRGPHLGATPLNLILLAAEFLWGPLRRCSSLAWNNQAALLLPSTAPQRNSAIPYIKSKSALSLFRSRRAHSYSGLLVFLNGLSSGASFG